MINFEFNTDELKELVENGFPNVVDRAIELTASEVWGNIGREAPEDEGLLSESYHLTKLNFASYGIWSPVEYRWWVHEGTGIYGPHGAPIVPQEAKALRFEIGGQIIYAKSVAGQEPDRFIDRSIDQAQDQVSDFIAQAKKEEL